MFRGLLLCLCVLVVSPGVIAQAAPAPAPAPAAPATVPVDPYAATVPVAGTSDAQRNAAIAAALTQVLQQVAPGSVPSADLLAKAPGLVREARYRRAPSGNGLELQVVFDHGAIDRVVAAAPAAAATPTAATPPGTSAPPASVGGSGTLWVAGIDSSHAFASLLSILRGDSALHDVTPVGADGDGVWLHLSFDQPLANVLAPLTGPAGHLVLEPQPHPGADASLRWVP